MKHYANQSLIKSSMRRKQESGVCAGPLSSHEAAFLLSSLRSCALRPRVCHPDHIHTLNNYDTTCPNFYYLYGNIYYFNIIISLIKFRMWSWLTILTGRTPLPPPPLYCADSTEDKNKSKKIK